MKYRFAGKGQSSCLVNCTTTTPQDFSLLQQRKSAVDDTRSALGWSNVIL